MCHASRAAAFGNGTAGKSSVPRRRWRPSGTWACKCKGTAKHITWFNPAQYAACSNRSCSALFSDAAVRATRPDQRTREAWVESERFEDEKKAARDSRRSS